MRLFNGKLLVLSVFMGASSLACTIAAPSSEPSDSPASNDSDSKDAKGSKGSTDSDSKPSDSTNNSPSTDGKPAATGKDIVDTAVTAGNFKTLVAAVQKAELEQTLRGTGPFTVFAPTDAAFGKLPAFIVPKLTSDPYKTELGLILKYHVVSGRIPASAILGKAAQKIPSAAGGDLEVDGANSKVTINASTEVTQADVDASNGVIHAVDSVLLPSIFNTANDYDDGTTSFKTLATAIKAADLQTTLHGPGTFTVFAPTDKAFQDLEDEIGAKAFNAILADKAKLAKILTYHVLGATAFQNQVKSGNVATVQGQHLKLIVDGDNLKVGDSTGTNANVILTDLPNRNGVIHVVDKVLLPQ
ncbi:MAG: fasciclin domain-containing protein [Labilithrix sp.]